MKLLPQYSIRLMLGITALVAGVFSIVGLAAREHAWAIGVSLGVGAIAVALATYAAFFGILWVFSVVASPLLSRPLREGRKTLAGTTSPFASGAGVAVVEAPIEAILVDDSDKAVEGAGDSDGGGL